MADAMAANYLNNLAPGIKDAAEVLPVSKTS
jgi:hypothetical protein